MRRFVPSTAYDDDLRAATARRPGAGQPVPEDCDPDVQHTDATCSDDSKPTYTCERDEAGECSWTPDCELSDFCGGIEGLACDSGQFCDLQLGTGCVSIADASGYCRPIPDLCTQQFEPVCGCDGKDYGNACEAHAAGVAVAHEGTCK